MGSVPNHASSSGTNNEASASNISKSAADVTSDV